MLGRLALAAALASLASLALATVAYAQDGRRWPGRTITYHESPPSPGVRDAAKAWNRSGVRIRFERVSSRRRADVVVRVGRRGCAGFAQLGYAPGRQALMHVLDCPRHDQMLVSAHEFGHILGLGHETRRCALMNPVLVNGAPDRCPALGAGMYRCRVFERHDLRRAARKYGGRPRVARRSECHLYPAPEPLAGLEVIAFGTGGLDVRVTLGAAPRPVVETFQRGVPVPQVQLAQAPGPCPADLAALFATPIDPGAFFGWERTNEAYLDALPGEQCVAARLVDGPERAGPASGQTLTPPPE